jgi:large subunit ribosomal protein L18
MTKRTSKKLLNWRRRKARVRKRITGTSERPRLTIYRSAKHIYAQVIDDTAGVMLAAASTLDKEFERAEEMTKSDCARRVGEMLASRCLAKDIDAVVFDRNGFPYRSRRVSSLAEGAREAGLKF